jgi:hypothetical protein
VQDASGEVDQSGHQHHQEFHVVGFRWVEFFVSAGPDVAEPHELESGPHHGDTHRGESNGSRIKTATLICRQESCDYLMT